MLTLNCNILQFNTAAGLAESFTATVNSLFLFFIFQSSRSENLLKMHIEQSLCEHIEILIYFRGSFLSLRLLVASFDYEGPFKPRYRKAEVISNSER